MVTSNIRTTMYIACSIWLNKRYLSETKTTSHTCVPMIANNNIMHIQEASQKRKSLTGCSDQILHGIAQLLSTLQGYLYVDIL